MNSLEITSLQLEKALYMVLNARLKVLLSGLFGSCRLHCRDIQILTLPYHSYKQQATHKLHSILFNLFMFQACHKTFAICTNNKIISSYILTS